jgi:hypothetical protein
VEEHPLEVLREAGDELLAREHVRPQHPWHGVRHRRHHEEDDRCEGEAAEERHYIKASQT